MRGTHDANTQLAELGRFIPAYAGNTNKVFVCYHQDAVHPRVCGEHLVSRQQATNQSGSSPRMRGTHIYGHLIESR